MGRRHRRLPPDVAPAHRPGVLGDVSPDGSWLVSASHDGAARIWDAKTGEGTAQAHRTHKRLWSAAVDPAGTTIATAGDDLVVWLWDAGTGEYLHTLDAHTRQVWSVAFGPDGSQLASAGDDGTVRIWSLAGGPTPQLRSSGSG